MASNRRNNTKQVNVLRDYSAPLIIVIILVLVVLSNVLWGGEKNDKKDSKPTSNVIYSLADEESEILMFESNWSKIETLKDKIFRIGQKMSVTKWISSLSIDNSNIKLQWISEIVYDSANTFNLLTWNSFVNAATQMTIKTSNSDIALQANTVAIISKNAVSTDISILKWSAKIVNNIWSNVVVNWWKRIILQSKDSQIDVNAMEALITDIDFNITEAEWYKLNSWDTFLTVSWTWETNTTSTWTLDASSTWSLNSTWTVVTTTGSTSSNNLVFTTITDEMVVTNESLDIDWTFSSDEIASITINWKKALIDWNTFSLKWFILENKTNDLFYKAYWVDGNLLTKWYLTVVYNSPDANLPKVENYTSNSEYKFLNENPYSTKTDESQVQITWLVPRDIAKVSVNWFFLTKFVAWSGQWIYNASALSPNPNLREWINLYRIEYFDSNSTKIYENVFVINKK